MKKILLAISLFLSVQSFAQISKVSLQASGLTCSMCSNSINKALKTIPYVDKVMANIKTSTFDITFKPGSNVHFDDIKKKVEDAGFFVAGLTADINFSNQKINNDEHIKVDDYALHFVKVKGQTLDGVQSVKILDKGFVSSKEYKKNQAITSMSCYKTGIAADCCSKSGVTKGNRVYHVTLS